MGPPDIVGDTDKTVYLTIAAELVLATARCEQALRNVAL
jgi:hypothetical protein